MGEFAHDPRRQPGMVVPAVTQPLRVRGGMSAPGCSIQLFGSVRLALGIDEVIIPSRNARALLAILALDRRPRHRDLVAADLWPDLPGQESGAALRQALWQLRTGVIKAGVDPASILESSKDRIGLQPDVAVALDVATFEQCLADRPARIEEAVGLYGGDLAEGMNVESLARERERLADLYEDALAEAARSRLRAGDFAAAHHAAVRLLGRDPIREEAHAVLIELYGLSGSRSQVARQYRRLQSILAAELNVEPLKETQDTYEVAIRRAALNARSLPVWALDRVSRPENNVAPDA